MNYLDIPSTLETPPIWGNRLSICTVAPGPVHGMRRFSGVHSAHPLLVDFHRIHEYEAVYGIQYTVITARRCNATVVLYSRSSVLTAVWWSRWFGSVADGRSGNILEDYSGTSRWCLCRVQCTVEQDRDGPLHVLFVGGGVCSRHNRKQSRPMLT